MKMRDAVIFILASLILSGCASLRDTRQSLPLACSSKKCQVEISQTGETLNAPGVYEFKRQKELNLTFRSENESIKKSVQGEIRWKESVLPNSLFALLGPGGWVYSAGAMAIDWYTGNMWDLETPPVVSFKNEKSAEAEVDIIVIAPVQAATQLDSEEAVSAVLDYLKVKYPKAQIELPELYLNAFDEAGWDYSGIPRQKWKRYELYAKLKSSYVAIAQVNSGLHIEVRDVLRQKEIATADVPFSPSSHKSFVGNWVKSQLLGMNP